MKNKITLTIILTSLFMLLTGALTAHAACTGCCRSLQTPVRCQNRCIPPLLKVLATGAYQRYSSR